jgi:hypothetical protein
VVAKEGPLGMGLRGLGRHSSALRTDGQRPVAPQGMHFDVVYLMAVL